MLPQVNKIEILRNLQKYNQAYRSKWSGQGCINKLIILSIVIYVIIQKGFVGLGSLPTSNQNNQL